MRKPHSISEARSNLPKLVREAESGQPVELTRRGERVAVLIGRRQYDELAAKPRRFSEAWDEFTREIELTALDIDPDELFTGVRDARPGRNVGL